MKEKIQRFDGTIIWRKIPLLSPKITYSNPFILVGDKKRVKYATERTSRTITHKYIAHDLKEFRQIESFFINCKGRLKGFFIPSHKIEFTPIKGLKGDNYFTSKKGSKGFWSADQDRYLLFVNSDEEFGAKIKLVSVDKEIEYIFLDRSLSAPVTPDTKIYELIRVRFNSDTFTATKNSADKFELELDFKEIWGEKDE